LSYGLCNDCRLSFRDAFDVDAPAGLIENWLVSEVFDGSILEGATELDAAQTAELSWVEVAAEASGITNLAEAGVIDFYYL